MNTPLAQLGPFELPEATADGIVCGACSLPILGGQVHHENVRAVRFCFESRQAWDAEAIAEQAAERANERYFEDRGFWVAREDEEREFRGGWPLV